MARYTGPVCKLCRREQTKLFLKGDKCYTKCVLDKRPTPPGPAKSMRSKPSTYSVRLREKQKLRRMTFMTEKPFARFLDIATKTKGASGLALLRLLDLRLDNVIRRAGFATSLRTARQLALHGHVKLQGRTARTPSALLDPGDVVTLDSGVKENVGVKLSLETAKRLNNRPAFLEVDEEKLSVKVLRVPERDEMSWPVNELLIIEYYSR